MWGLKRHCKYWHPKSDPSGIHVFATFPRIFLRMTTLAKKTVSRRGACDLRIWHPFYIHVAWSSHVEFPWCATRTNQEVCFRDAFASNKTIIVPFAHCLGNRVDQQKKTWKQTIRVVCLQLSWFGNFNPMRHWIRQFVIAKIQVFPVFW